MRLEKLSIAISIASAIVSVATLVIVLIKF